MPIDLTKPLEWKKADPDTLRALESLQGNILKGHGRHYTANIFFNFGGGMIESKRLLRRLANFHITNAHRQLLDAEKFKETNDGGGAFCHLALSKSGYAELEVSEDLIPSDQIFRGGMRKAASLQALGDDLKTWDEVYTDDIHAVLLCAHDSEAETGALSREMQGLITDAGCAIVDVQHGKALFNGDRQGIEHFGYVDGRSQPLMLVEDIQAEADKAGIAHWDPVFPLSIALVPDRGARILDRSVPANQPPQFVQDPFAFGSYFIYRKLEQDVRAFKRRELDIAINTLGLAHADRELAGAMLVGRFEDGTPVTMSPRATGKEPLNDFNYAGDNGTRCPFHAHIRKTNPRGSGGFEHEPQERLHLMPRRGIPYEDVKRTVQPTEVPEAENLQDFDDIVANLLPPGDVGLLFMAYNHNIEDQFQFTQKNWSNFAGFPRKPPPPAQAQDFGIDPITGQGTNNPGVQKLPGSWDDPATAPVAASFSGFVTTKGGEYFFSPSLAFLKAL